MKDKMDQQSEALATSIEKWRKSLEGAWSKLQSVTEHLAKTQTPEDVKANLSSANDAVNEVKEEMKNSIGDLKVLSEYFTAEEARSKVTSNIVTSWPGDKHAERTLWIGYALVPAGISSIALIGGQDGVVVAMVLWAIAVLLLFYSLGVIKRGDERRWEYYNREYGLVEKPKVPPN